MTAKEILAIIPARGGSKGVRKKNIKNLGARPLIGWTLDAARESGKITRVVVSTEDKEIADLCGCEKIEVVPRPMELAQDNSPTVDSIIYTLRVLEKQSYHPDIVLLLQCTSPFRTASQIDEAISLYEANAEICDAVISVKMNDTPPQWLKNVDGKGFISDYIAYDKSKYARRQDFPVTYMLNGAIYISTPGMIFEYNGFESPKSMAYVMDGLSSLDIDTEADFKLAEYIYDTRIS